MDYLTCSIDKELFDEEALQILNAEYHVKEDAAFWLRYNEGNLVHLVPILIAVIRKNRNKEPDFAEGENEPDTVCAPPTRAGC